MFLSLRCFRSLRPPACYRAPSLGDLRFELDLLTFRQAVRAGRDDTHAALEATADPHHGSAPLDDLYGGAADDALGGNNQPDAALAVAFEQGLEVREGEAAQRPGRLVKIVGRRPVLQNPY